ncbi:unnamed protein product [Ambrosiozyma monospora]|uniref:Unnamed protein product n=1 Tax=Ambrosiozyma monospora TaxID=43982 RepID=A0A9W6Z5A5_AMBMO|nr:unnamed protein product [Ambrosiozyma monospora]GMG56103.1 unnamed protein product [Ambrosiozyma monospora]
MRASRVQYQAAKSSGGFLKNVPVELYPLFAACGVACVSAIYFSTKKLRTDQTLKLGRKAPVHEEKLIEAIAKE